MSLQARQRGSEPSEGCIATITSAKRGTQPTEQRGGSIEGVNVINVPKRLPGAGGTEDAVR